MELTERQAAVAAFIRNELKKGRPFPSLGEIADHFGFGRNAAKSHLINLVKKRFIEKKEGYYFLPGSMRSFEFFVKKSTDHEHHKDDEDFTVTHGFFEGANLKAFTVLNNVFAKTDGILKDDVAIISPVDAANKIDIFLFQLRNGKYGLRRSSKVVAGDIVKGRVVGVIRRIPTVR